MNWSATSTCHPGTAWILSWVMWQSDCAKEKEIFSVLQLNAQEFGGAVQGAFVATEGMWCSRSGNQTELLGLDLIPYSHCCLCPRRAVVGLWSLAASPSNPWASGGAWARTNVKKEHLPGHHQHHCCRAGAFILSWRPSLVSLKIKHITWIALRGREIGDLNNLVLKCSDTAVRQAAYFREKYIIVWVSPLGFHGKNQCRICSSILTLYSISSSL